MAHRIAGRARTFPRKYLVPTSARLRLLAPVRGWSDALLTHTDNAARSTYFGNFRCGYRHVLYWPRSTLVAPRKWGRSVSVCGTRVRCGNGKAGISELPSLGIGRRSVL